MRLLKTEITSVYSSAIFVTLPFLFKEQKKIGVIAASAGNHALALSYHGNNLGIPVTVIMPVIAPIMKIQACQLYNANVSIKGDDISEVTTILYFFQNIFRCDTY